MSKKATPTNEERIVSFKYYIINVKIRNRNSTKDLAPKDYSDIFRAFYEAGVAGKSSRQKECILTTRVEQVIPNKESVFWGRIVEMTNVNNKRWFNKKKREMDVSFSIPTQYAANAHQTEYIFIPVKHRFCYQFKSSDLINPYSVMNYLKDALGRFLGDTFVVQTNVETDDATIQRIFDAPKVERVKVKINYSNNDFGSEVQEFIENDLKNSGIGEMEISAVHKEGNSIEVNKSRIISGALLSSVSNGEAEATIRDGLGKRVKIRTKDSPNRIDILTTFEKRIVELYKTIINEFRKSQL